MNDIKRLKCKQDTHQVQFTPRVLRLVNPTDRSSIGP